MPVEVDDTAEPIVTVRHICEGCGELIDEFQAFEDSVETDVQPIHDSLECREKALEGVPA